MVDLEKLKKAIQKKGLSYSDIAKALGVTRSCVSHKMSGEIDFKVSQVYLLAELLELSDEEREEIFYMGEKTEGNFEKTTEEKVGIAVEVVNLLSAKKCTIDEAYEILNSAKWTIEHTSTVQKFEWKANPNVEKT
ncbi:MAG: helix-turn-helix transcriptional regulator [Acutalibacteraceae bacterium]|nr:helix-turn-helix transcriptional regulator [Acutalibacteraceae bacterium]